MRTIAISNQKGGSGKTTTAVNLAAALGQRGKSVVLVDLDAQCSATSWCGIGDPGKGVYGVFAGDCAFADTLVETRFERVVLSPASSWLVGVEKVLASEVGAEAVLRRNLERLPDNRWDYLLIDCPPSLGLLTLNALTAVGEILVPVESHVLALAGLAQLLQTVQLVKERLNRELTIGGILACRVDGRTRHSREVVESLRSRFGELVFETTIRENVRLAEAPSFQQPISRYAPNSKGNQDFQALAEEVIQRNA